MQNEPKGAKNDAGCPGHGNLEDRVWHVWHALSHGCEGRGEVPRRDLSWSDLELPACLPWACHFLAWSAWKSPIRPLAVPTSKSAANATTNPVECALVCWSAACAASDGRRCPARIAVGRGVTGTKVTSRQVATPFASMTQGVPPMPPGSGHPLDSSCSGESTGSGHD